MEGKTQPAGSEASDYIKVRKQRGMEVSAWLVFSFLLNRGDSRTWIVNAPSAVHS